MEFRNLKLKNVSIVLKHTPSVKRWRTKNRQTHILGIQLRGKMHHEICDGEITLTENSVFFFNQKDDFLAIVKELGESYSIHFTTYEPIETDSFAFKLNNVKEIYSLIERVERQNSTGGNPLLAASDFYRLLAVIESYRFQTYHKQDERSKRSKNYIDLHFKEKDCLEKAASESKVTRRRFNELFKAQFNSTPNRYLTSVRIEKAKELLLTSKIPIKQVAELSGFEDFYYFSKVFKKETGLSPMQFRKANT
jgi:AraC-like DNA-binding protein